MRRDYKALRHVRSGSIHQKDVGEERGSIRSVPDVNTKPGDPVGAVVLILFTSQHFTA